MIALDSIRSMALALTGTEEAVHFKLVVFGVRKRNFATFDPRTGAFSLRLPASDPARAAALARGLATPVPGKYGADGWATIDLDAVDPTDFGTFLQAAYHAVSAAPDKPARKAPSSRRSKS
jgi:hypothetical protein